MPKLELRVKQMTYEEAKAYLGEYERREVGPNASIGWDWRGNDTITGERGISVILYSTSIFIWHPNGDVSLNNGKWGTELTKTHLNQLLPAGWRLYSERKRWYLSYSENGRIVRVYAWEEGVTITKEGEVINNNHQRQVIRPIIQETNP